MKELSDKSFVKEFQWLWQHITPDDRVALREVIESYLNDETSELLINKMQIGEKY